MCGPRSRNETTPRKSNPLRRGAHARRRAGGRIMRAKPQRRQERKRGPFHKTVRWCMRHKRIGNLIDFLLVSSFIVALPFIAPVMFVLSSIDARRRRKAAGEFVCVECGQLLGTESLSLADKVEAERSCKLSKKYPNARLRIIRLVDAICPTCGKRYKYLKTERHFVPLPPKGDDSPESVTDSP